MPKPPKQSSAKLPWYTAKHPTVPPTTPNAAPKAKPSLRPRRCISCAAGTVISIVATGASASGRVASAGFGVNRWPTSAMLDSMTILAVRERASHKKSSERFFKLARPVGPAVYYYFSRRVPTAAANSSNTSTVSSHPIQASVMLCP